LRAPAEVVRTHGLRDTLVIQLLAAQARQHAAHLRMVLIAGTDDVL